MKFGYYAHPKLPLCLRIFYSVLLGLLLGCEGMTHIDGIVKNAQGAPLPNVEITLTQGERSVHSRSSNDGKFHIGMTHEPSNVKLSLSLAKDGYKAFTKAFHARDHLETISVTLQESPEPSLSEIRKARTRGLSQEEAKQLAELMCRQLPNAAAFPMKSSFSGDDVHDTLVLLSGIALPCLVDRLTDSTWMPDSRSEPLADFHAGDAALWILTDAGLDWDSVIVPLLDQKKWKGTGVYEYFYWVNVGNHRKLVQNTVKRWLQQHPECCGSEGDFSNTADTAPINRIALQRFAELQQAWTKLKPGMDEKLARQVLGPPDGEANPEHMEGVSEYNRFEKSAALYVVENHPRKNNEKFDFVHRDSLRDRYVIVFYSGNGKFARAFSNVLELPPIYPKSEKRWSAMIEASMNKM